MKVDKEMAILEAMLGILLCSVLLCILTPIHELGHVLALKYYGVASKVILVSSPIKHIGASCKPTCVEIYSISVLSSLKRTVIVHAAGGLAVIAGIVIYYFYPSIIVWIVTATELLYSIWEVGYSTITRAEYVNSLPDELWFLESIEENRLFLEEVKEYPNIDLYISYIRTLVQVDGFDLSEWK